MGYVGSVILLYANRDRRAMRLKICAQQGRRMIPGRKKIFCSGYQRGQTDDQYNVGLTARGSNGFSCPKLASARLVNAAAVCGCR